MKLLRIATRGSDLALAQARHIAARAEKELACATELVVLRTTGDRIQDRSLAKIGGKGLFVKEIEEALLDGRADVAVHSAKDMPAKVAEGCVLAAFPERVDSRDALAAKERGMTLATLPSGAKVGTGSTRRMALLHSIRPDLVVMPIRGNVPTRLARLGGNDLDAVLLACAGLDRLELSDSIDERISTDVMLPAVGQGSLALETREDDEWHSRIAELEDAAMGVVARAERAFQATLGGDCTTPLAGLAEWQGDGSLRFRGLLASLDGVNIVKAELSGAEAEAESLAQRVGEMILDAGGREILIALAAEKEADV